MLALLSCSACLPLGSWCPYRARRAHRTLISRGALVSLVASWPLVTLRTLLSLQACKMLQKR